MLVVVITFALILTQLFSGSDDDAIRSILDDTAVKASFEGSIHPLKMAQYAATLIEPVTKDVEIVANYGDEQHLAIDGRKALQQKLLLLRRHLDQLAVVLTDVRIRVDGKTAQVEAEGRAMGRSPGREDYFLEVHELILDFEYVEGQWKLRKAMNKEPFDPEQYPPHEDEV